MNQPCLKWGAVLGRGRFVSSTSLKTRFTAQTTLSITISVLRRYRALSERPWNTKKQLILITYGPHKAAAEVSNHNEPIGRGCVALVRKSIDVRLTQVADQAAWLSTDFDCHLIWGLLVHRSFRFKWVGCQLLWDWSDLFVKPFEMSIDLKFQWFGCQLTWNSNGWVVNWFEIRVTWLSTDVWLNWFWLSLVWDSNGLVLNWFEIQGNWLSIDLRFKWFGCRLIWNWSDLVVNRFEIQRIWLSTDLKFKWFGYVVSWFESQMIWLSTDLKFKRLAGQLTCDSNDSGCSWIEFQMIWIVKRTSSDLKQS